MACARVWVLGLAQAGREGEGRGGDGEGGRRLGHTSWWTLVAGGEADGDRGSRRWESAALVESSRRRGIERGAREQARRGEEKSEGKKGVRCL